MGKKRLRVEVLLAATALPSPPPAPAALLSSLLPDPTCADPLPEDDPVVTRLLRVLPEADVYLQDEVQLAFHPTLTRVWCPAGRRGQRTVQAPGDNATRWATPSGSTSDERSSRLRDWNGAGTMRAHRAARSTG